MLLNPGPARCLTSHAGIVTADRHVWPGAKQRASPSAWQRKRSQPPDHSLFRTETHATWYFVIHSSFATTRHRREDGTSCLFARSIMRERYSGFAACAPHQVVVYVLLRSGIRRGIPSACAALHPWPDARGMQRIYRTVAAMTRHARPRQRELEGEPAKLGLAVPVVELPPGMPGASHDPDMAPAGALLQTLRIVRNRGHDLLHFTPAL